MRVRDLTPGDQFRFLVPVRTPGVAVYVAQTAHPLYPGMRMVIWRMPDGSWSHDALDANQDITQERVVVSLEERGQGLRDALLGDSR